ncbi:MAG: response regulator transcription factor [Propionibacterium sp.]|nr:response regulator transcription factor [Propionibacterium sp.]
MSQTSVLIVDDQELMAEALRVFVDSADDLTCVGIAHDGQRGVEMALSLRPDVVLMDLKLPLLSGVEATRRILAANSDTAVVAITTMMTDAYLEPAFVSGISGFLLKDSTPQEVIMAVRAAARNSIVLSKAVRDSLLARARSGGPSPSERASTWSLTPREIDVLTLLARGYDNRELSRALEISEATVKAHMSSLMAKAGVTNRVHLVVRALQDGVVAL